MPQAIKTPPLDKISQSLAIANYSFETTVDVLSEHMVIDDEFSLPLGKDKILEMEQAFKNRAFELSNTPEKGENCMMGL